MIEKQNIPFDVLQELVLSVDVKPRLRNVLITIMTDDEDITNPMMSSTQYIVAVSKAIPDLQQMDKVLIDLKKLTKRIQPDGNKADTIEVIDIEPFFITYEDVEYVCAFVDDHVIKSIL